MYEELELSEADGVLAAYNAVCELVEDTERLQAACAAKEAELAELRGQTAELFGARLDAEGLGEEAVTAAKAMWQHDPENAARAVLGCDIVDAANPYGCNQYGHEWRGKHGSNWKQSKREGKETQGEKGRDKGKEQKRDALGETLVKTRREASQLLDEITEELNKQKKKENGLTPELINLYNLQGHLRQEIDSFEQYDSEQAAERLTKTVNDIRNQLKKATSQSQDSVKSSRSLEELLEEADLVESANPYGCNQYGHEWKGKHGEGWKPSGRGGESGKKKGGDNEKKAETPEKKDERKGPPKRPDGSFIIPSIGKAKAIPTYIPKPKGLSEREQLINDTVYRPEWQVRKPVIDEADKALNKLRERLKKEKTGSETWTKYKTHEHSINGFVSRMLNSTTERQRREQMRFLLQYLEQVDKDLNS